MWREAMLMALVGGAALLTLSWLAQRGQQADEEEGDERDVRGQRAGRAAHGRRRRRSVERRDSEADGAHGFAAPVTPASAAAPSTAAAGGGGGGGDGGLRSANAEEAMPSPQDPDHSRVTTITMACDANFPLLEALQKQGNSEALSALLALGRVFLIFLAADDERERSVLAALQGIKGLDQRCVLFCQQADSVQHMVRFIEPAVHIDGDPRRLKAIKRHVPHAVPLVELAVAVAGAAAALR